MVIKKKRINSLSCLSHVEEGKNLVMALRDATRFKNVLLKLIFREFNRRRKNFTFYVKSNDEEKCRAFYIKDKTKPKEQYSQILWWTRHEWAGRRNKRGNGFC